MIKLPLTFFLNTKILEQIFQDILALRALARVYACGAPPRTRVGGAPPVEVQHETIHITHSRLVVGLPETLAPPSRLCRHSVIKRVLTPTFVFLLYEPRRIG